MVPGVVEALYHGGHKPLHQVWILVDHFLRGSEPVIDKHNAIIGKADLIYRQASIFEREPFLIDIAEDRIHLAVLERFQIDTVVEALLLDLGSVNAGRLDESREDLRERIAWCVRD